MMAPVDILLKKKLALEENRMDDEHLFFYNGPLYPQQTEIDKIVKLM